ncbi:uncharacterized protein TNCT_183571 [Trichonephila clavata]|uniref:Uncharacterized protein n=1 Tax=Trichonephila clavata TaxID=2740835 RepID=A0A8X6GEE4_TRICU|nr:uncharacterized protein TNCT_183571 [Trichonephila clavata]
MISLKKLRVCTNCLSEFHAVSKCNSKYLCFVCKQKHHTLLHKYATPSTNYKADLETLGPDLNSSQVVRHSESDSSSENTRDSFHTIGSNSILINTAIVYMKDSEGIRQPLRVILDCASESSFISSRSSEALGL